MTLSTPALAQLRGARFAAPVGLPPGVLPGVPAAAPDDVPPAMEPRGAGPDAAAHARARVVSPAAPGVSAEVNSRKRKTYPEPVPADAVRSICQGRENKAHTGAARRVEVSSSSSRALLNSCSALSLGLGDVFSPMMLASPGLRSQDHQLPVAVGGGDAPASEPGVAPLSPSLAISALALRPVTTRPVARSIGPTVTQLAAREPAGVETISLPPRTRSAGQPAFSALPSGNGDVQPGDAGAQREIALAVAAFERRLHDIYLHRVISEPTAIQTVPVEYRDLDICCAAVQADARMFEHVPDRYRQDVLSSTL